MNPVELNALHILHVFGVIALLALIFFACAAGPDCRVKLGMWSGLASLLVALTGIRMWQGLYHFTGIWVIVKIVAWLALSAIGGMAYKRREKAGLWISLSLGLALIALVMVYVRPF